MNRYRLMDRLGGFLRHMLLALAAAACLFPLLWMVRTSLMTNQTVFRDQSLWPAAFNGENYARAWAEGHFGDYFLNSLFYTAAVVAGILLVSVLAAYAFSRLYFPGRNVLFYVFVAAMMVPLPGSFVPLFVMMSKLHLVDTRSGYILCMISAGLSLSILVLKIFFDRTPAELEDAARIDGCGRLQILWYVTLPLARPALLVVAVFNALNVWNEFVLANLLLNDRQLMPLQTGLMAFQGRYLVDYPVWMAGLTITALPVIIFYIFVQGVVAREVFPVLWRVRR